MNIISISSQLAAGPPNAQFGKTQFFFTRPVYFWCFGCFMVKKMANSNGDDHWSRGGWTGQGSWPWLLPLPPFYDRLCFLDVKGDHDDTVHELEHLSYYLSWIWRWCWRCWWWWTGHWWCWWCRRSWTGQGHPHLPRARDLNTVTHSALHFSVMGSAGGKSYVLCKTIIFFSSLLFLYSVLQYTFA